MSLQGNPFAEIAKLESVFSELPAGLALLRGPTFIFELANGEYMRLRRRKEVVGKPLLEVLPELASQKYYKVLTQVFETGETFQDKEASVDIRDPETGEIFPLIMDLTYRRLLDAHGQPYGIFVFLVDVTEKVIGRRSVQLERIKLESVFENATASLAILKGREGTYEKANAAYLNLFQNRPLLGRTLIEAIPELKDQKFPQVLARVFETGVSYEEKEAAAYLRRTFNSPLERRYFDQKYLRINDHDGKPYGVLIEAVDVTERVLDRRRLAESQAQFRVAIEGADMATWEVDLATGLVCWTPRLAEIFGYAPDEKVLMDESLRRIHPEDEARARQAVLAATSVGGDGKFSLDCRVLPPNGALRWVSIRGQTFFFENAEGKPAATFTGIVLDTTERELAAEALRKSEKHFRAMANGMPQVVWTARPDGIIDYANERWRQYAGATHTGSWVAFMHRDDVGPSMEKWNEALRTGQPYQDEFRLMRYSDHSFRWFLVRAQASVGADGKIDRWFGTCTDIEEQKAALAARSEFMSIASHELKTPLTSLMMQTQTMRRNFERGRADAFAPERIERLIKNNEKQMERLVRLIDDMIDFARIEAGRLLINKEETEICGLLGEVFEQAKEQMELAGCEFTAECETPFHAFVDRFRTEQVLTNLLTNAQKYGRGSPVHLSVWAEEDQFFFSVSDRGRGIAEENKERIFQRFERAVSANEISGLGLGLFISRQIVEAHGGKIWVESLPDAGATFYVALPRV